MSAAGGITFTVFTPTYNRRHLLGRTYRSLCAQTFRDFEWLIIDDGSSDETGALVAEWIAERRLDIRYQYQTNQGKHRAHNRALQLARGEFFTVLDSDDEIVPEALERFLHHWETIPIAEREHFSGVTVLCASTTGKVIGDRFPESPFDSDPADLGFRYQIRGDKWGFHRTELLRRFPFPTFSGERFMAEGIVWNRLARRFKVRCVNEALQTVEYLEDGLSASSRILRMQSPFGACLYYREALELPGMPFTAVARCAANYVRFCQHADLPFREGLRRVPFPFIGWTATIVGATFRLADRLLTSTHQASHQQDQYT